MKSLLIMMSVLSFAFVTKSAVAQADAVTGRATIVYSPASLGHGVLETDLRQVGNKILGQSSALSLNFVNLTVGNGSYQGVAGGIANVKCGPTSCSGFINGQSAQLNSHTIQKGGVTYTETTGMINNQIYSEESSSDSVEISTWNILNLKKGADGSYSGRASIGLSQYDVSVKLEGSMQNFLNDPALVAIFLGAPIAHH